MKPTLIIPKIGRRNIAASSSDEQSQIPMFIMESDYLNPWRPPYSGEFSLRSTAIINSQTVIDLFPKIKSESPKPVLTKKGNPITQITTVAPPDWPGGIIEELTIA